jgi:hypothetical protein
VAAERSHPDCLRRSRRISIGIAVAALYLALALASTWPLTTQLGGTLPQGTDRAATVPLVQAWTLWWTSDRIAAGFSGFWDAPIFYPARKTFAFSYPLLLEGFATAPVFWAGGSPALAHNLFLLLALVLNGGIGFGLLRSVGLRTLAAAAGGAMLVMLPYVHHELGVLALVPLAGLLGTLWAVVCFVRRPSLSTGLALGLATAATYLLCEQYATFIGLVLAPAALWLVRRDLFEKRALASLAAAAAVCMVLVAPLAAAQLGALEEHGFRRSERTALRSASYPSAWLSTPWPQLVPLPGVDAVDEVWMQAHFPGTLKLALALAGLGWGLRRRESRRWTALLLTAALLAALLSALPRLELGQLSLYRKLYDVVPGLAQMRAYWRFIVVSQICVALLAAQGIHAFLVLLEERAANVSPRKIAAAIGALGFLAAVELWPARQNLAPAPDLERWRPWTDWVRQHVAPEAAVVHLPFPSSGKVTEFEETGRWMYLMTTHARPMANGYSSFFPKVYNILTRALRGCPRREGYDLLRMYGFRVLAIRSSWLRENPTCAPPANNWERAIRLEDLDVETYVRVAREP